MEKNPIKLVEKKLESAKPGKKALYAATIALLAISGSMVACGIDDITTDTDTKATPVPQGMDCVNDDECFKDACEGGTQGSFIECP